MLDEFLLNSINQSLTIAEDNGFTQVYAALDADRRERFGCRPEAKAVTTAIEQGDPDLALALLDEDQALLNAVDESGNAPIHLAVMMRQLDTIRALAARGVDLDHTRFDGARPVDLVRGDYWFNHRVRLPEAIQVPEATAGFLLALGAEYTLRVAIILGDMERVRALVTARPELVNQLANDPQPPSAAGDHNRDRPIKNAAQHDRLEIARLLLDMGADPNGCTPMWAPQGHALFEACARGNVEMAKMLLEAGANPNVEVESSGNCFSIMERNDDLTVRQLRDLLIAHGGVPPTED